MKDIRNQSNNASVQSNSVSVQQSNSAELQRNRAGVQENSRPALRFNGFTEEWEVRKLGEVAEIVAGGTPDTNNPDYWDGDIDWYAPAELENQRYVSKSVRRITKLGLQKSSATILPADITILFTSRAGIGKTAILKHPAATNQGFQSLVLHNNIDPYFVYSMSAKIKRLAENIASGSTFLEISGRLLGGIEFPFPSLPEQSRIGTFFRSLDNLIALRTRKLEKLRNVKKAFLEKMFVGQNNSASEQESFCAETQNHRTTDYRPALRFKGFDGEWVVRKLGEIGKTYTGLSGKTKDDFGHGQAHFVTYMNVYLNPISCLELTEPIEIDNKQNEVEVGDVFFTTSSETPNEVGMSSVLLEKQGKTYLNSFCFGYRPFEKNDNYYLAYMLRSDVVRKNFILLAQGISRYNISKNKVMELAVSFPSLAEQSRIGAFFRSLDNLIALQEKELAKLKNIKQACLGRMFV